MWIGGVSQKLSKHVSGWSLKASQDVLWLMFGVGASQLLAFAGAPVLARTYSPEAFGGLAVFVSVVGILGVVGTGRMELAVPLEKETRNASASCFLGFFISAFLGGIVLFGIILLVTFGPFFTGGSSFPGWIWLVPIGVMASAGWRILNYWHTRGTSYRLIALSYIVRAVGILAVQIGLALWLGSGPFYLVGGNCLGLLAGYLVLLWPAAFGAKALEWSALNRRIIQSAAQRHRRFLTFGLMQALANTSSQHASILILALLFSNEVVGQVSFAIRLLSVPVLLIADALRRVTYQRMASVQDTTERFQIWRSATIFLATIGLFVVGVTVAWGPDLFAAFLGPEWMPAGHFARILVLAIVPMLVNPPSVMALSLFGLQDLHFRFEVLQLVLRVLALVAGASLFGVAGSLGAYSVISLILNAWLVTFVCRRLLLVQKSERDQAKLGEGC